MDPLTWILIGLLVSGVAKAIGAGIEYKANKDARELEEDLLETEQELLDEQQLLEDEADELDKEIIADKQDILTAEYDYEMYRLEEEQSQTLGSMQARSGAAGLAGASPLILMQHMSDMYSKAGEKAKTVYSEQMDIMDTQTEIIDIGGEIRDITYKIKDMELQYERDINAIEDKYDEWGLGLSIGGNIGEAIFSYGTFKVGGTN